MTRVAAADVDGDGAADVFVPRSAKTAQGIASGVDLLLRNTGDGVLAADPAALLPALDEDSSFALLLRRRRRRRPGRLGGRRPRGRAAQHGRLLPRAARGLPRRLRPLRRRRRRGDLDGDGDADLVTTAYSGFFGTNVFLGDGAGAFAVQGHPITPLLHPFGDPQPGGPGRRWRPGPGAGRRPVRRRGGQPLPERRRRQPDPGGGSAARGGVPWAPTWGTWTATGTPTWCWPAREPTSCCSTTGPEPGRPRPASSPAAGPTQDIELVDVDGDGDLDAFAAQASPVAVAQRRRRPLRRRGRRPAGRGRGLAPGLRRPGRRRRSGADRGASPGGARGRVQPGHRPAQVARRGPAARIGKPLALEVFRRGGGMRGPWRRLAGDGADSPAALRDGAPWTPALAVVPRRRQPARGGVRPSWCCPIGADPALVGQTFYAQGAGGDAAPGSPTASRCR